MEHAQEVAHEKLGCVDRRIDDQGRRAVEIETLKAQAEIEPLERMATQLASLKRSGPGVLKAYVRNVRMSLFGRSERAFTEVNS